MLPQPNHRRFLSLLGLGMLTTGPLVAQTLYSNGGTLFVNTGGTLTVNGGLSQTGAALLRTTGAATVSGDLTSAATSTLDLNAGTLSVTGDVAQQGTTSGSTGTLRLSGTGAQSVGVAGGIVPNLTVDKASGTATLTQTLRVRRVLAMTGTGDLDANGQALTLLSDATGTALLANLGTGQVSGDLTVQRYIDGSSNAGLGYRHLAAPTQSQTVADFGSGGQALTVNSAYNSSATPDQVTPFPTVFRYDQARLASSPATTLSAFDKGWLSPVGLADQAQLAFQGYTVMLPGASTLSFTGAAAQTQGTIPLARASGPTAAEAGWNFIGNPYASPLDLSTITAGQRSNLDAAFYTYESTGQYTGQYRSYVNSIGNPLIGTAQAFFVRVSSGSTGGSLTLDNSNRVTDYARQAPVRRTTETRPLVQLALTGNGLTDTFYAYAEAGATAGFDPAYDAAKLPNSHGLNLSAAATATTEALGIDGRPAFAATTTFPLAVGVPAAGAYTLTAAQVLNLPAGLTAYLHDAATGQLVPLSPGTSYSFGVTAAQAQALLTGRFTLQFSARPLAATPAALAAQVSLYPNPTTGELTVARPAAWGPATVEVYNTVGQVVLRRALAASQQQLSVQALPAGVYSLRLTTPQGSVVQRLVRQ